MISVEVEVENWRVIKDVETTVDAAAKASLAKAGAEDADVTILLADDETVADLNQRFRGREGPTNVLSFPAPEMVRPMIGDLALAYGVCAREADAQAKSLADHLSHLVVHGVLHLMGRDHMNDAEADAMEAEEREILAGLGIADPYEIKP